MLRRLILTALLGGTALAAPMTLRFPASTTTVLNAADLQANREAGTGDQNRWTGPVTAAPSFTQLIPSWNAVTPPGSGAGRVTLEVRARQANGWTRWYSFGSWTTAKGRSSIDGQRDAAGTLNTDTLSLTAPADAYQYRVTVQDARLTLLAFTTGTPAKPVSATSDRRAWGHVLNVPPRSQMIYPGGGEVWCSPTSTSMILAYWGVQVTVPQAAAATYDDAYEGTGNWPFNTAYAGSLGLRAFVARLPDLTAAERYLQAGVPLAVSLGWKKGELPGAPIPASDGHLMVLVGFDAQGNPVLNDPAAPSDATVRRTYPRAAFEHLWQTHSSGTVYVIAPPDRPLP